MSNQTAGKVTRRGLLSAGAVAVAASPWMNTTQAAEEDLSNWSVEKGRIHQSVVPWCFKPMKAELLIHAAAKMGLKSVELTPPENWPLLKRLGLVCAITSSHSFTRGWNHQEHHAECVEKVTKAINATADAGFQNVITFSGMRGELSDDAGKRNMVEGLKKVLGLAEKRKVNLCIEPLNTRVDEHMKGHPGYQCDTVEWAVDICDRIGSPRVKILFDIYHVQIMQGDVITRIRQFKDYIAHYHTAGNPGRAELDDNQEINYPAIMKEIVKTGYTGHVGQEFIPREADMIESLRQAVRLCDV